MPTQLEDLKSALQSAQTTDDVRYEAWEAFHKAGSRQDFVAAFKGLNLPQETKRALWFMKYPEAKAELEKQKVTPPSTPRAFDPPKAAPKGDAYTTRLTPQDESRFQGWAKANNIRMDEGWNEDYDMRGLWKADPNTKPDARGHFPDTFKKPNHPTFSNESKYATADAPKWVGHKLIGKDGKVVADETPTTPKTSATTSAKVPEPPKALEKPKAAQAQATGLPFPSLMVNPEYITRAASFLKETGKRAIDALSQSSYVGQLADSASVDPTRAQEQLGKIKEQEQKTLEVAQKPVIPLSQLGPKEPKGRVENFTAGALGRAEQFTTGTDLAMTAVAAPFAGVKAVQTLGKIATIPMAAHGVGTLKEAADLEDAGKTDEAYRKAGEAAVDIFPATSLLHKGKKPKTPPKPSAKTDIPVTEPPKAAPVAPAPPVKSEPARKGPAKTAKESAEVFAQEFPPVNKSAAESAAVFMNEPEIPLDIEVGADILRSSGVKDIDGDKAAAALADLNDFVAMEVENGQTREEALRYAIGYLTDGDADGVLARLGKRHRAKASADPTAEPARKGSPHTAQESAEVFASQPVGKSAADSADVFAAVPDPPRPVEAARKGVANPAQESAEVFASQPVGKSAAESASVFMEQGHAAPPTPSTKPRPKPSTAEEAASAFVAEPPKSAAESAQVFAGEAGIEITDDVVRQALKDNGLDETPGNMAELRDAMAAADPQDFLSPDSYERLVNAKSEPPRPISDVSSEPPVAAPSPTPVEAPAVAELPAPTPVEAPKVEAPTTQSRVRTVKTKSLKADPVRFQYKTNVGKGGVSDVMQDDDVDWNPDMAGVLAAWRDPADGNTYVINGHHRFNKAMRKGVEDLDIREIQAKDAKEARAIGALINIAEGQGTALDAAKVFRDMSLDQASLSKRGIHLKGPLAKQAKALSDLSTEVFSKVVNDEIPVEHGVVIGKHIKEPVDQIAAADLIARASRSGKRLTSTEVEDMVRRAQNAPKHTTQDENYSLFGNDEITQNLAIETAILSDGIRKQLAQEKRLFSSVGNEANAEKVGAAGKAEQNAKLAEETARALEVYNKLNNSAGPISQALSDGAIRIARGENASGVRKDTYESIRRAVSEVFKGSDGKDAGRTNSPAPGRSDQVRPGQEPDRVEAAGEPEVAHGQQAGMFGAADQAAVAAGNESNKNLLLKSRLEAELGSQINRGDAGHVIEQGSPLFSGRMIDDSPAQGSLISDAVPNPPKAKKAAR